MFLEYVPVGASVFQYSPVRKTRKRTVWRCGYYAHTSTRTLAHTHAHTDAQSGLHILLIHYSSLTSARIWHTRFRQHLNLAALSDQRGNNWPRLFRRCTPAAEAASHTGPAGGNTSWCYSTRLLSCREVYLVNSGDNEFVDWSKLITTVQWVYWRCEP